MHVFFGPFPLSYTGIARPETLGLLTEVMNGVPKRKPFQMLQDKDLTKADKEFLLKVMKLDPRSRPTAAQLLEDKWLSQAE
jgi:serine/threonine protein kinase